MDEIYTKEVDFTKYCKTCKYRDESEDSDRCNECLNEPARFGTRKPLNYKEAKVKGKRVKKTLA